MMPLESAIYPIKRSWYRRWLAHWNDWRMLHIGSLQVCYWCSRTFLYRPDHGFLIETGADVLCSEECVHEYAKTL